MPTFKSNNGTALQKYSYKKGKITCFSYRLYVTTFLGYGVNEALRKYEQKLSSVLISEKANKSYVRDPCLPRNLLKTVNRKDGSQFSRRVIFP